MSLTTAQLQKLKKEIVFRSKNAKQIQAVRYWMDDETEQILYGGAKGGGKSYLLCTLIFADALMYPGTHYYIARKELIDLRNFTIPTIYEVFKNWDLKLDEYANYNANDHVFNLYNGSKVYLIACKEEPSDPLYERFGSMQMTRGAIEEAGEVAEAAKSNLWLAIGRWKNEEYKLKKKLLFTANPKRGWLKRDFVDLYKQEKLPVARKYIQAFATDNPYLPAGYVDSLRDEKDTIRRQRLFEGNWDYDEDQDALVKYAALNDSFTNPVSKDGQKYMTVDVARQGKDFTIFGFWDGLELYKIEKFEKQSTAVTEQKLRDFAIIEKIPYSNIMIDEDGIGGAVVDHLIGVRGFVANSAPLPTQAEVRDRFSKVDSFLIPKRNFANLKAQCGWKLAELINEHKIAFKVLDFRDIIIEELSALLRKKDVDSDGKNALKPKDKVKEDLGRSPDVGDILIFRSWFELSKDSKNEDPVKDEQVINLQKTRFKNNRARTSANSTK